MHKNQIYKCNVCGNIVEILQGSSANLVCCEKPMELLKEKTEDPEISMEKHVPVIEKTESGVKVKVGSVEHPMEEKHYIQFIEIIDTDSGKVYRKDLKPGMKPEAEFCIKAENIIAREYCNLHGLWSSK